MIIFIINEQKLINTRNQHDLVKRKLLNANRAIATKQTLIMESIIILFEITDPLSNNINHFLQHMQTLFIWYLLDILAL